MKDSQILKQAKHYFGKDRSFIKELILSIDFKEKDSRKWEKEIASILPHANWARYNIFHNIPLWIKDNQIEEIDWNWIGALSWDIVVVLNPNIHKGYDWGSKLASKCKNGTMKFLTLYISDVFPCYTFECHYVTYNKKENYYESGPLLTLTKEEKNSIKKINTHLKKKNFQLLEKEFCSKNHKELYSDCNNGNASLFDVLFDRVEYTYATEIRRWSDKDIIEKNGTKFFWRELYDNKGMLKERTEGRYTISGDLFRIELDAQHHIKEVSVIREIEGQKHQQFDLNIIEEFKKQQQLTKRKKGR